MSRIAGVKGWQATSCVYTCIQSLGKPADKILICHRANTYSTESSDNESYNKKQRKPRLSLHRGK